VIRVGIGGWVFKPWRGTFYPQGLAQARELEHASRAVTSIEINGTFYGSQKPESFRRWAAETPDDFVFSLKGRASPPSRRAGGGGTLDRAVLRQRRAGAQVQARSGALQLPPTKAFEAADFAAFLALLPQAIDGRPIRHASRSGTQALRGRVRYLMRQRAVAIVLVDSPAHPLIADATADFLYLRLQRTAEEIATGYAAADLKTWAKRARAFADGGTPADLATLAPAARKAKRDVSST